MNIARTGAIPSPENTPGTLKINEISLFKLPLEAGKQSQLWPRSGHDMNHVWGEFLAKLIWLGRARRERPVESAAGAAAAIVDLNR